MKGSTGIMVSLNQDVENSARDLFNCSRPARNVLRSIHSHIPETINVRRDSPNHSFLNLRPGQIQTAPRIVAMMMESQVACTEISALDGDSQPPKPSSRHHSPERGPRTGATSAPQIRSKSRSPRFGSDTGRQKATAPTKPASP